MIGYANLLPRVGRGVLNVRDVGAAGDGVRDDGPALQLALTAAALGVAHTVYIPSGTYYTTRTLYVSASAALPVTVQGDGPTTIIRAVLPTGAPAVTLKDPPVEALVVRNLRLTGAFSRGIDLTAVSGSDVRAERCCVSGATLGGPGIVVAGIRTRGLDDVWIVDCDLTGNGASATNRGADILKDSGATQSGIHVVGCRVRGGGTSSAIALFDVTDSEVRDNRIDQGNQPNAPGPYFGGGYGITVYDVVGRGEMRRNEVTRNHVANCSGSGIYLEQSDESVIADNIVHDTCKQIAEVSIPTAGIVANGCDVDICGNRVRKSGKHGIAYTHAAIVQSNTVQGCVAAVCLQGLGIGSAVGGNALSDCTFGLLVFGVQAAGVSVLGNSVRNVQAPLGFANGATLSDSVLAGNAKHAGGRTTAWDAI